ncbi:MAG TPA: alpha/beta hydrolase-fold protein [Acidobacteriaceae bacterium]|nr:alpha/beta hydrolase-fold protein [Acidobacteriaceae bacterium]
MIRQTAESGWVSAKAIMRSARWVRDLVCPMEVLSSGDITRVIAAYFESCMRICVCFVIVAGMVMPFGRCDLYAGQATPSSRAPACSVMGNLQLLQLHSRVFHNTRTLRVWLPPAYSAPDQSNTRFPVLYLNDGQDLFNACTSTYSGSEWRVDETATRLIDEGKVRPLIIVGIDNAGRRDRAREYLPFPDDTLRPAMPQVAGKLYPKFLVTEVMPLINRLFRTDRQSASTGIGGSSYGAGIALYTVLEKPGMFGRLLLESASVYAHDDYLIHRAEHFSRWPDKVFLGVGTWHEPVGDVERLKTILVRNGLVPARLRVQQTVGAEHEPAAWAARFSDALQFLYPQRD